MWSQDQKNKDFSNKTGQDVQIVMLGCPFLAQMKMISEQIYIGQLFLAVQDSSIGDLVTHSLSDFWLHGYNDYNDYNGYNDYNDNNDYDY